MSFSVTLPVSIATPPQIFEGSDTTLTCITPNHERNLTYKWFANDDQQPTTENTLVLSNVPMTLNGTVYRCEVSTFNGVSGSGQTVLHVKGNLCPYRISSNKCHGAFFNSRDF